MFFTQGHALLIGVGSHRFHPDMDVPITVADANAVAEVLADRGACAYLPGQVQILHDEAATKAGILAALDGLAQRTRAGDTVFLFFCGHGASGADGVYYLAGHDVRADGPRVVAGTGVSEGELLGKLQALPAQRILLIFNACHSGHLSPSLELGSESLQTSNPRDKTSIALLGTGQGRIIITACRDRQVSYIGQGQTTLFTTALLEGLRGTGVRSNNGFISAFSLYEHIYESVSQVVKAQLGAVQEPELTVLKGVGPFAVALHRGSSTLGDFAAGEPLPAGMAVREASEAESIRLFEQRVLVAAGDITGGNKTVYGDEARGDVIKGSISHLGAGAQGAIGKNVNQTITHLPPQLAREDLQQVADLLAQLKDQIAAADIPETRRLMAAEFTGQLEQELTRWDGPPDGSVIKVAGDWLIRNIPHLGGALAGLFLHPVVGRIVEAAGDVAAGWVQRQFGEPGHR